MRSAGERDRKSLERRLEVLGLPVAPLQRQGVVAPRDRTGVVLREPEAVGVGPDGMAYAVWPYRTNGARKQVTWHIDGERPAVGAVEVQSDLRVSFVQPLPEQRLLLVAARAKPGVVNAEVWTSDGDLVQRGNLGDAIEELLTTPSGRIWAGYFDEAMGGQGPEGHGLARFRADLTIDWLYPFDAGLPVISDCYSLNVEDETAHFSPYTEFHIFSASREKVTDWGASPYRSAHNLLKSGPRLAALCGWGPEYDLVTLLRIDSDGIHQEGGQCRIVLPDGIETHRIRYACRGAELHAFARSSWYRTSLEDLIASANSD